MTKNKDKEVSEGFLPPLRSTELLCVSQEMT